MFSTTVFILFYMKQQSISYFEHLSFSSYFFTYQLDFSLFWPLNLLPSDLLAICITCFRVSGGWFWLFLVLFWMLWMLATVHKMRNVPQASKITTTGTVFTEIFFDVSKEWVSSWSHVLSITKVKTLAKKLLAVRPEKRKGRKKRKKNWNDNCKALCVKLKRKKKHFVQYFKKVVMDSRYALNITGSLVI